MNTDVLIDLPMPIITPRLIIRPPQEGDGQAMHEAKVESYDELYEWMIWIAEPKENLNAEEDEIMCREKKADFILRKDLRLYAYDRETGRFIGGSGIHDPDWQSRLFRTGYWVRTSEAGKGYGTEISVAIAHYVFKALGGTKLSISHGEGNDASKRIIEKTGYSLEGIFKKCDPIPNNKLIDSHKYGLFNLKNTPDMDISWGNNK